MQDKKQQLELDMGQLTSSKYERKNIAYTQIDIAKTN